MLYFSKTSVMRLASIFIFLSGVSKRDAAYNQNVTIIFLFLENKQQKKEIMGDSIYFELADNEIFQQLEDSSKGDFYIWNSTSLGNLSLLQMDTMESKLESKQLTYS